MRYLSVLIMIVVSAQSWAETVMVNADCPFQYGARIVSLQGQFSYSPNGVNNWRPARIQQTICQGSWIRVEPNSRASLRLSSGVVLRLDQGSVLVLGDISPNRLLLLKLLSGFVHFISRTPVPLQITTPIANAGPEGTEFAISASDASTSLWVYEGKVKFYNDKGDLTLNPGQGAQARLGQAPQARIDIKPEDAVHWALYYPPLLPYHGSGNVDSGIANAINNYRHGHIDQALSQLDAMPQNEQTPYFYKVRAAIRLSAGQDSKALDDIRTLLQINPNDAEALALKSVLALTQNRKDEAYNLANQAVAANPKSATAYSALSYTEQGRFHLDKAQLAANKATQLAPEDAMVWARKAELELAQGLTGDSRTSAGQALKLDPGLERTQTVTGFTQLLRMDADDALASFTKAIELDSTSPLARLGLGLAKIRNGDLAEGREDIEIAAILDPNNSLIRSYLGKAYYEERRNPLAEDQFNLAKERDPKDPTPYFYDAIEKQTTNRPVEALRDMQQAIDLNDNRGVYRSKLYLDQDSAARSANLARIYNDLGFGRVALKESWKALNQDSTNPTAHRFLSDAYIGQPRYRAARASELLQAQLLQPLNITPVQPQLTGENIGILNSTGPGSLSVNEYDPLFNANGAHVVLNGAYGSRNTITDNAIVSGIYDNLSGSLGQFHYQTDGFRQNDGYKEDIYDAFAQYAFTPDFSGQIELKSGDVRAGDVPFRLNGDIQGRKDFKEAISQDSIRVGGHLKINPKQNLIGSFIYSTLKDVTFDQEPNQSIPFFTNHTTRNQAIKTYQAEVQHLISDNSFSLVSGLGLANFIDRRQSIVRLFFGDTPINTPPQLKPKTPFNDDGNFYNGYFYLKNRLFETLTTTLGLSVDSLESRLLDRQQIDPKFGLVWNPLPQLILRGAAFRTLKRPLATNQTIEPTQLAGFNQFFDEFNATSAWQYSFGVDYRIVDKLFFGGEVSWREGLRPKIDKQIGGSQTSTLQRFNQSNHLAYLYWTPTDWLALKAEYRIDSIDRSFGRTEQDSISPIDLKTQQVPLSINFFHPSGLFAKFSGTYVDQKVFVFSDEVRDFATLSESFWTFDAALGYRLPKRLGVVSFEMRNLFDNHFRFQSAFDSSGPQLSPFIPERQLFAKINIFY